MRLRHTDIVSDWARPFQSQPIPFKFRQLLSMASLARYLDKPSGEAARKWCQRYAKSYLQYCGREIRIDKRDVDRVLAEHRRRSA